MHLDLAEIDGCPGAWGLRRIHLFEDRARVAHFLLGLEVPDEDGRTLWTSPPVASPLLLEHGASLAVLLET